MKNHSSREARSVRARRSQLAAIYQAGSGHPGGSLSCTDILTCLWDREYSDSAPGGPEGHQFVLSKGHACPALYAVGAEFGLLSTAELLRLRKLNSPAQGHAHVVDLPWTGASTGSLGQGFSVATGKAMAMKMRAIPGLVTALLGDGELQEGEVWEAAMFAAHHELSALRVIVDFNKLQSDDWNKNILGLEPLADKWRAFGWQVIEADGHNFQSLDAALEQSAAQKEAPTVVIAHTLKGKGVSFMENSPLWHGSVQLTAEQLQASLLELGADQAEIDSWTRAEVPLGWN